VADSEKINGKEKRRNNHKIAGFAKRMACKERSPTTKRYNHQIASW